MPTANYPRKTDFTNEATDADLRKASDRARYAAATVQHALNDWLNFKDEAAVQQIADAICYLADAQKAAAAALQSIAPKNDLEEVIEWRRSQRTKNNTAKISSEIISVWRRHGAGEAWQTALLWSCGDRAKAARLVSDLDARAHVRDGILSYGGLSLQDVTEVEPPA